MLCTLLALSRRRSDYFIFLIWLAQSAFAPLSLHAQCQVTTESTKAAAPGSQTSPASQPEFFDEPKFTVAGVTDTSTPGGHGADTIWRTQESLTRETVALNNGEGSSAAVAPVPDGSASAAPQPRDFDANHHFGELLLADGKPQQAVTYLERASRLNPDDYQNSYELAVAYADAGNYKHARGNAQALLARQDKPELHHLLGNVEEKLGNPVDAVREYQRAAELDPSEPNLFDWGADLLLHHAPEPAAEVFSKGNRLFPRSTRMLIGLGVAWYSRGSNDEAARCLCEASDLNPSDPNPYLFLAKIRNVQATPSPEVAERLKRFVTLQPENAMANYLYATALWAQRSNAEDTETSAQVESLLQKAVHLDPKLGDAYLLMGNIDSDRKDLPGAIEAYKRAITASPGLEEAHYRLAQAYRQAGDKSKAQRELDVYQRLSKESLQEAEGERRDLQQFVYTLRDQTPAPPPQ
jgi:tetratricopeptide (TPR) repeat protein